MFLEKEDHLERAVRCSNLDIVQALINAGAKVTEEHLKLAVRVMNIDFVQTLINAGAKVTGEHLMTAVKYHLPDILQILINAGAKVTDEVVLVVEQEMSEIKAGDLKSYDYTDIAETYTMLGILTRQTTQEVLAKMERDKTTIEQKNQSEYDYKRITKQELLDKYKKAIKYYIEEMQYQIAGVTLTKEEQKQLNDIFASGTEKDYFVRINFVGFTGAGKTSIMLQMFLQKFEASKITSTDGIDICLGYCIVDLATGKWRKYDKKEHDERLERMKSITMNKEHQTQTNKKSGQKKITKSGATKEPLQQSNKQHTGTKVDEEPNPEPQSILLEPTHSYPEQEEVRKSGATGGTLEGNDQHYTRKNTDMETKPERGATGGTLEGSEQHYTRKNTDMETKPERGARGGTLEGSDHYTRKNTDRKPKQESDATGEIFDEGNQQHTIAEKVKDRADDLTGAEIIYDRTEMHHGVADQHLNVRLQQATGASGRNEETAFVNGFDYAGQATYYALHQLFFSKRGINLIVLDASRDFDVPIDDEDARHIGGHLIGNSKDFFRYWSKLLRYFLPRSKTTKIITVFTHKDLVEDQSQLQDKKCDIQDIIDEMEMNEMFYKDIFCVNANDPVDIELPQLRDVILELSKIADDWGQRMSSRWLLLEDKLMTKKSEGIRVMTLTEVEELNEESSLRLESRDELLLFLKVHHDIGTLIHFADEGLQDVVILDAQWLVDSFKTIISAKQFKDNIHRKEWKRLHQKAVVDKGFMLKIWRDHANERFYEFRDELILFMNRMDLISSPRTYNDEGQHAPTTYYVVPCMLQKAPENFLIKYQRKATYSNNALSFEFEYSFLPTATVYRLLATCIMQYGDSEKSKTTVFCNSAVFNVYRHHFLTLEITSSSIIANILVIGKRCVDVGVCQGVKEFLDNTLKCIIDAQKTTTKYEISVACGNVGEDGTCWLKWKDLIETSSTVCDNHKNDAPHAVDSDEIIKQWCVTKIIRTEPQTGRQKIHDKSKFHDKPTHHMLGRISRRIPRRDIHLLFTELGLGELGNNPVDLHNTDTLLLLFEWLVKPHATLQVLATALEEQLDYRLDIDEVQSVCHEWREDCLSDIFNKRLSDATDADLDTVCLMTGAKYLELALELGFIKEAVDAWDKDHRLCHKITRQIIKSWTKKQKHLATWKVLGDALYEIRANPEFIKDICNTTRDSKKSCTVA